MQSTTGKKVEEMFQTKKGSIFCSTLMINEIACSPARSDTSILLTMNKHRLQSLMLCFVLHMPNIIWLNSYYITIDQRKLLTVCYLKFKKTIQICSPLNISQSINAHVTETKKACTVTFMKARNSLVVWCREESKNRRWWKSIF